MTTTLRSIGNSKGLVVPAHLLKELDIQVGDPMEPTIENGKLVFTPITKRQKYKLADLLAKCDESAPMPQELVEWDAAQAVGNEI